MKSVSLDIEVFTDEELEAAAVETIVELLGKIGFLERCVLRREQLYPLTPGGMPYLSFDLQFKRGSRYYLPSLQLLTLETTKLPKEQGGMMTILAVLEGWGDRLPRSLMAECSRLNLDVYLFNLELFERDKAIWYKNTELEAEQS